ncbi:hypothetical protein HC762_01610, partial [bacterium]|nr:hypothetical protein [bacterium]
MEASYRGLLFNSKELDFVPTTTFPSEVPDESGDLGLTPDEWLHEDSGRQKNTFSFSNEQNDVYHRVEKGGDGAGRMELLRSYSWLYLDQIRN